MQYQDISTAIKLTKKLKQSKQFQNNFSFGKNLVYMVS